eukprot:TRINITY_DN1426_c0_g1_i2.p1 TRINITY_DN1426_c0_g1~~TRINITY_DN1426_c0_g1_i2.p1  ORF type:complete len:182 (+),score=36.44 TRINITY_DN1426_c0_g1_i2:628-1173(+)
MIPRVSYFSLLVDNVIGYFSEFVLPNHSENDIWFESNGIPLKWHIPFGVLFDALAEKDLPWTITVHFQNYPEDILLLGGTNMDIVQWNFKQTVKQATYIKYGDTMLIKDLSTNESAQHWNGLRDLDFDEFWSVNKKLMKEEMVQKIPIRIILPESENFAVQYSFPVYQTAGLITFHPKIRK